MPPRPWLIPPRPSVADFHRVNRGGGLFSESVSQWLGAVFALVAQRLGLRPTALTIANLVLGLAASVTVVALADEVAAGTVRLGGRAGGAGRLAGGVLAGLRRRAARPGDQTGRRGRRPVDVLCDVAAQIALVAALCATAVAQRPTTPTWLVAAVRGHLDGATW